MYIVKCLPILVNAGAGATRLCIQWRSVSSTPHLVMAIQGKSKDSKKRMGIHRRFGDDSWFTAGTSKAVTIGVADGVGGWREEGVDAGAFAKELMCCCCSNAYKSDFRGKDARKLLVKSFDQLKNKSNNPVYGSSTACLLTLDRKNCMLHSANLGDSGFMVLRDKKIVYKSEEQQHGFNTPYQLALPPSECQHSVHSDAPEQATAAHLRLQEGDLILLATDGLFDNIPKHVLRRMLGASQGFKTREQLQAVADILVDSADEISHIPNYESPFSLKASKYNQRLGNGGKPDDITVILAKVAMHPTE